MKKKREISEKERKATLRFIRKEPRKLRSHKKMMARKITKEDLVTLLIALWHGLGKIGYRNIMPYGKFNGFSRKALTGMYGNALRLARAEGIV